MHPNDPATAPAAVPNPTDPDFMMPDKGEAEVASVTHEVDTDDMFDPMAG